jgi:hypothetical protein
VILLAFGWIEGRVPEPIIPLGMFRNRTVLVCCITLFLGFFQLISMSVLMPLRLQMIGGVSADHAALRLLPLTLSIPCGAFLAGRLMSLKGRYKPLQFWGSVAASIATFSLAYTQSGQVWQMVVVMMVLGLGIGFQFPTGLVATQNSVPMSDVGLATALTAFSRLLGGAVGVAVLTSILIAFLRDAMPNTVVPVVGGEVLMDLFHAVMNSAADAQGAALRNQAESAFHRLFLISGAVTLISPVLISLLQEKELRVKMLEEVTAE